MNLASKLSMLSISKGYLDESVKATCNVVFFLLVAPHFAGAETAESNEIVAAILNSTDSLIKIKQGTGNPILLIQGLDFLEKPIEWLGPFELAMKSEHTVYFFKWSKFNNILKNRDELLNVIQILLLQHSSSHLTLVGYSAGGVLALLALDQLTDSVDLERLKFHLVAAPVFGYNIGNRPITYIAAPFIGKTSVAIGAGVYEKLKNKDFGSCHQWITTNCELDSHACQKGPTFPQTGNTTKGKLMVCGSAVTYLDNESHTSVLNTVMSKILD